MAVNPTEVTGEGGFIFDPATYRPEMLPPNGGATYELPTNPGREFEDPFDLDNLKFYRKEDAVNLVRELEGLDARIRGRSSGEKIVAVIGTGGTIAMVKENGELVPRLDADALLDELPASKRGRFKAAAIQLPTMIDSSLMHPDVVADTVLLMSATYNTMSESLRENFAGFLITHGTDTMAQSAAQSRMMLGRNVPFNTGFVGAQKTIEESPNDVSANIDGALTTLWLAHNDKGATHHFVFMNGTSGLAMNQVGIVKTSDTRIEAFESPIHEPLVDAGNFAIGGIRQLLVNFMKDKEKFRPLIVRGDVEVEVIYAQQGRDPDRDRKQVKSAGEAGKLEGVVVVTYGGFTFHVANFGAIKEEADRLNVPVFVANPFPAGSTEHEYGPAQRIRESGAVPVRMMPSALLAKIHIGRAMYADVNDLIRFIGEDYVGEMPTINSRS
jgi:L-asparaginase/Glu-tRNA(Gln) amidotransferase subunit D